MSVEIHRQSEQLVAQAERLAADGGGDEAVRVLYLRAAVLEARAFDAVPRDRPRTRGIVAVSSVRLFMRAHDWRAALRQTHRCLAEDDLPEWAERELDELAASLRVEALRGRRRVLTLLFDLTSELDATVVPSRLIGDAMSLLQQTIQAAANDMRGQRKLTRGRIRRSVEDATRLSLATMLYGSVGVALVDSTSREPTLWEAAERTLLDMSTWAVMSLLSLVATEADHHVTLQAIGTLGPRGAGKLRQFAQRALAADINTVKLRWNGIDEDVAVRLDRVQMSELVLILNESEQQVSTVTIEGRLASADRLRRRFSIETYGGEVVAGTIVEEA